MPDDIAQAMNVAISTPAFFGKQFLVAQRMHGDRLKYQAPGLVVRCRKAIVSSPAWLGVKSQAAPAPTSFYTRKQSPCQPEQGKVSLLTLYFAGLG